jgi:hypothetical protein
MEAQELKFEELRLKQEEVLQLSRKIRKIRLWNRKIGSKKWKPCSISS